MNLTHLASTLPWPLIAALLAANLIPYVSALLTRSRGWWTGVATLVLSFVTALLANVAQSTSPVHWKAVLATTFGAWVVAVIHHSKILAGTPVEAVLHHPFDASRRRS